MNSQRIEILEGLFFAILWASATPATKFAVHSVDPFLLTCIRFFLVGAVMLVYGCCSRKNPLERPTYRQFRQLFILGTLNITVYMTGYLIAITTVSAGLISLVTAMNPLILVLLSAVFLKRKLTPAEILGSMAAISGLVIAAIPNLRESHATLTGIVALVFGIAALSVGSIYFSKTGLTLTRMTVNMWQIIFGTLLLVPVVAFNHAHHFLIPDLNFFLSLGWLAFPVSVGAYMLWLKLLHQDAVRAGFWMFLTPVLGYSMAVMILRERLTLYGMTGAILVVAGLFYSRRKSPVSQA